MKKVTAEKAKKVIKDSVTLNDLQVTKNQCENSKPYHLTPQNTIEAFKKYLVTFASDVTPPSREDLAKRLNHLSYSSVQKKSSTFQDEGEDSLKIIDSQLVIWYTNWIATAETKIDFDKRVYLAKLNGIEKTPVSDKRTDTLDFDLQILEMLDKTIVKSQDDTEN